MEVIVVIYHCSVDVERLLNPMHMEYIVSFFKITSYGYQLQQSTVPEASSSVCIDMYMTQNHSYHKQALRILKNIKNS